MNALKRWDTTAVSKPIPNKEDMKSEYDFSSMKGVVRGKYYKAYRAGHKVVVHKEDGTVAIQYFKSKAQMKALVHGEGSRGSLTNSANMARLAR